MTDLERFRPPQKAARWLRNYRHLSHFIPSLSDPAPTLSVLPRCIHRTHRLLAIQSTTPEELYERKIRLEEYGEAISLARAYGLDCDTVYQQQWEKAPTSVASIRNYLVRSEWERGSTLWEYLHQG